MSRKEQALARVKQILDLKSPKSRTGLEKQSVYSTGEGRKPGARGKFKEVGKGLFHPGSFNDCIAGFPAQAVPGLKSGLTVRKVCIVKWDLYLWS